jgi:molecular chaperone GrpE
VKNKDQNKKEIMQNEEILSGNNEETAEKLSETPVEDVKNGSGASEVEGGEVAKLQGELAEQKDKYIRLYSEFENFRRRTAKEKLEMVQSANEQLIKAMLPVADDFERAEKAFKDRLEGDKTLEGFVLIYNKFKKTLDQYGVKPMDIPSGADFNADVHEAITQIPVPDEKLKGKVVDVVEKGYLLNEKVIRFAKVVVGS